MKALTKKFAKGITWTLVGFITLSSLTLANSKQTSKNQARKGKIGPNVERRLKNGSATVSVVIQANGNYDAERAEIEALGGQIKSELTSINGFAAELPASAVASFAGRSNVKHISGN